MHGINNNTQSNLESDGEEISRRFRTQSILLYIIFLPAKLSFQHYCVTTNHKCKKCHHFCWKSTLLNKNNNKSVIIFWPIKYSAYSTVQEFLSATDKNNLGLFVAETSKRTFAHDSSSVQQYGNTAVHSIFMYLGYVILELISWSLSQSHMCSNVRCCYLPVLRSVTPMLIK
jgi:hypothetical protein